MSAGAFSDANVIQAAERLSCIFVECNWGKANPDLSQKYKVTGYPTVVFCDPDGGVLGRLSSDEPGHVAKQMLELGAKFGAKAEAAPAGAIELRALSVPDAILAGKQRSQPAILFFRDDSPASTSVIAALTDPAMKPYQSKLTLGIETYTKGAGLSAMFDVTRAPTVLVVDTALPKPHEKPLSRNEGSRSARELMREFERILAREPSGRPGASSDPGPLPKAPEEKLSDDQVERLFIQARVSVAQDMVKRGKKDKAIEIYEDLIKTYPKHVDIVAVKKLLEEARK